MKLNDIIQLAKDEYSGGGNLQVYTPDTTIYNFAKNGLEQVTAFFPLAKVLTVEPTTGYFDIPQSEDVGTVLEVVALISQERDFNFSAEDILFATKGGTYMSLGDTLENWIYFERNLRAYKVLIGNEFEWEQSEQDPHRIYLDNVPNENTGFTVKFTTDISLPDSQPDDSDDANIDLPSIQTEYLRRWVLSKIKMSDGAVLKRFKGTGQAAETDGREVAQEGKKEHDELWREMKERGYSTLSV